MAVDTQTLHGVDDLLRKLQSLPPEIVSKRGGPVKRALRKGGLVIQKQAIANIRAMVGRMDEDGYVSTDLLAKSVVVRRDPNPQRSGANERYRVLVSRGQKWIYPATVNEKTPVRTIMTARWLEFGTEKRAPTPWMTPAFFSHRQMALNTIVQSLEADINRIIRKMNK